MNLPIRLGIILPNLRGGGAERVLLSLYNKLDRKVIEPSLILGRHTGERATSVAADDCSILGTDRARSAMLPLYRELNSNPQQIVLASLGLGNAILAVKNRLLVPPRIAIRLGSIISIDHRYRTSGSPIRSYLLRIASRILHRNADLVICQSDFMRRDALDYLGGPGHKFVTIHNPLDFDLVNRLAQEQPKFPLLPHGRPRLVTVGRLEKLKGHSLLLDAFARVQEVIPSASLTILGEGPERLALERKRTELRLRRCILPGYIMNPYPFVSDADLFVLPSVYEAFSNSLLEAIALKTPCVATDCPGGNREIIQNGGNGWLAPSNDPAALSRTILFALSKFDCLPMDEASQQLRSRHDLNLITRTYLDAILRLTHEQRG